jgi:hypothetical protein
MPPPETGGEIRNTLTGATLKPAISGEALPSLFTPKPNREH